MEEVFLIMVCISFILLQSRLSIKLLLNEDGSKTDLCKNLSNVISFVIVDEYQDVTTIEHKMIKMLVDKSKNLFVVGNDDEGIFKAYGADASYIDNFKIQYINLNTI